MLIQGEKVDYINVEEVIGNIFGNSMHRKRQESLANAVLGVLSSASLIVHRIGMGLADAKRLFDKHAVKQVDRLLSKDKLQLLDCFQYTVPYVIGPRKEIVMVQSMSYKGCCWDNAVFCRKFFGTLKQELVYHCRFKTREEAKCSSSPFCDPSSDINDLEEIF